MRPHHNPHCHPPTLRHKLRHHPQIRGKLPSGARRKSRRLPEAGLEVIGVAHATFLRRNANDSNQTGNPGASDPKSNALKNYATDAAKRGSKQTKKMLRLKREVLLKDFNAVTDVQTYEQLALSNAMPVKYVKICHFLEIYRSL
jgi:hypothetical protein